MTFHSRTSLQQQPFSRESRYHGILPPFEPRGRPCSQSSRTVDHHKDHSLVTIHAGDSTPGTSTGSEHQASLARGGSRSRVAGVYGRPRDSSPPFPKKIYQVRSNCSSPSFFINTSTGKILGSFEFAKIRESKRKYEIGIFLHYRVII
jgi:hypothetical protein